jgi:hypothetical protein
VNSNLFPRGHEQRKKQFDWLARNTNDIITQSHSLFAWWREKNRQVQNGLLLGVAQPDALKNKVKFIQSDIAV